MNKTGKLSTRPKTRPAVWLLLAALVLLLAGGAAGWYLTRRGAAPAGETTYAYTVRRGDIALTATGQGTLVSGQAVNLGFTSAGRVAEVRVKLGDSVKTGDVLARLDQAPALEADVAAAQANLLKARQALASLQSQAGSALALAYQDLLDAQSGYDDQFAASQRTAYARCANEALAQARAALEAATEKVNGLYLLDPHGAEMIVAQYDYDTALANYNYCAAYTATEKTSASASLEIARARLDEAQSQYDALKVAAGVDPDQLRQLETRVDSAQAQLDTAQDALDGISLTAPMDGRVTYLAADAGTIVDTATFLTISDVSHPLVTLSLDETDLDQLVVGNAAQVSFTALPDQTYQGVVSLANPAMIAFGPFRAASGQVTLDPQYATAFQSLPLGMSATVVVTGKAASGVLLVPVDALTELRDGTYEVSLTGGDGQVIQQVVRLGIVTGTQAEVTSGLSEGDVIRVTRAASSAMPEGFPGDGGMMFPGGGPMP